MRQIFSIFCLLISFSMIAQFEASETASAVFDDFEDSAYYFDYEEYVPMKSGNSWTLMSIDSGIVRHDLSFDQWIPQGDFSDFYTFRKDNKYGALDMYGDTLLPFEYDTVIASNHGIVARQGNQWVLPGYFDFEEVPVRLELDSIVEIDDFMYLYNKGKVGLYFRGRLIVPPTYAAVQPLEINDNYAKTPSAVLAFDGSNYRFFDYQGQDILETATSEFELMRDGFLRYQSEGRWKYYNFFTEAFFDSNGNDVVIYTSSKYKIYGPNRSNASLYYSDKTFSGHQDYFPLGVMYVAYNSNGKVGLMESNGTICFPARYDRVEVIDSKRGYFKFFQGDSCGVVTKSGEELFHPAYANIISTGDPDRFIVLDKEQTGVVDRQGDIIIPIEYDHITYGYKCFLLQKRRLIGLAGYNGETIYKPQFSNYRIEKKWGDGSEYFVIVFKDVSGKLMLCNNQGKLTAEKFDDFNMGNQTYKLYRKGEIEVVILNDKAEIEESVKYPNVGSLVVDGNKNIVRVHDSWTGWDVSYLEENQLNGKFGLRYFQKRGLAVEPIYKEIQTNRLSSHFGQRLDEGSFELVDGVTVRRRSVYDQMYMLSAKNLHTDLISAESIGHVVFSASTSTSLVQNKSNYGTIETDVQPMPFNASELDTTNVQFSQNFGRWLPKMFLMNVTPVLCDRSSAEMSLYQWYHYYNFLGGLRITNESALMIMNPNLGVRFEGGTRRISDYNKVDWDREDCIRFNPWENFYDFRFTKLNDFIFSKETEEETLWTLRDYKWGKEEGPLDDRLCVDFKEYPSWFETMLELKEPGRTQLIVHEDFPDFEYVLNDSLPRRYFAGRLIKTDENGMSLVDPKGKVYAKGYQQIRYLGESHFAVKSDQDWRVIGRNGQTVINRTFSSVGKVKDGKFTANKNDLQGIYSVQGDVIVESSGNLEHTVETFYRVQSSPQEVWFDAYTEVYDTLQPNEKYLGNSIFLAKAENGSYNVRLYGESKAANIESDIRPYLLQNAFIYKNKKKLFVMESRGAVSSYKKASKPREYGSFLRINGKKSKLILNADGKLIHEADEKAKLKPFGGDLWVHTSDTNYLVTQSGELLPFDTKKTFASTKKPKTTLAIEIVREGGKQGAYRNGEEILPPVYDYLSHFGEGEFQATQEYTKNLFNAQLEQQNPIPYNQLYLLDEDLMIIELNGDWYCYKKGEYWERIK